MNQANHYKITAKVQNGLGVLARITILLRKFNVNISSLEVEALDENKNFYNLYWTVDSTKNEEKFSIVVRKLERLIPVVSVLFKKLDDNEK